jgi:MFS family permease
VRGRRVARQLFRDPVLARLLSAYGVFCICENAVWIAVIVYAYGRGGPTAAGLVAAAQLAPAALSAPIFAAAADRHAPGRVLVGGYLAQATGCVVMATTAALGGPSLVVYAGAVLASTFVAAIRPAQTAVLPGLARDVAGLTAANAAVSWLESAGIVFAGFFVAILVSTVGLAGVFLGTTAMLVAAAALVAPVRVFALSAKEDVAGAWSDTREAFQVIRANRSARLLVGLLAAEFVVVGALDVLFAVLAIGVLHAGAAWTGYLNAAYGVGGMVFGALVAMLLGRRLGPVIAMCAAALGAALALTTSSPHLVPVVIFLIVVGAGRAGYDVAARSLLQRVVAAELVARVFGVAESVAMCGLALGSLLTPLLVAGVGKRGTVVGVALVAPVVVAIARGAVMRLDDGAVIPVVEIALLRSVPLFRDLPSPALEGIARSLVRHQVPPRTVVLREGAPGDDFIVIAEGAVEVTHRGHRLRVLHRGDGAGEIALLRDVPRTATVTALTDVVLYRLPRQPFLTAVNAHVPTQRRAEQTVRAMSG